LRRRRGSGGCIVLVNISVQRRLDGSDTRHRDYLNSCLIRVLFIDIIGVACLVAGFTATDTAKVNAERANLALRILPESSSRILPMSYTDFFLSRLAVTCEFF
jgi:hypothetical protein